MSNPYELTPHIAIASAPLMGDVAALIERIGGWTRLLTLLAMITYFVACVMTCLNWRKQPRRSESRVALLAYHP